MRARSKRLIAVATAAVLVTGAAGLTFAALGRHADLFYTPELLLERGVPMTGQRIRLGGFVETGSLVYGQDAEMRFNIIDGSGEVVSVAYTGIAPDLFREGEGVVATGAFGQDRQLFLAEEILAKHDENYQPRELEGMALEPDMS